MKIIELPVMQGSEKVNMYINPEHVVLFHGFQSQSPPMRGSLVFLHNVPKPLAVSLSPEQIQEKISCAYLQVVQR